MGGEKGEIGLGWGGWSKKVKLEGKREEAMW